MKIYTCNEFKGHYPVGTAAVIVASNKSHAARLLEGALRARGLDQSVEPTYMVELLTDAPNVVILCDGNY